MAEYLHLYTGATAGKADGTEISAGRTFLTPVSVDMNGAAAVVVVPIGVRCDTGYKATGVDITTDTYKNDAWTGVADARYKFSTDGTEANAAESISLDNVGTTNTIIYLHSYTTNEAAGVDKSTGIKVSGTIVAG